MAKNNRVPHNQFHVQVPNPELIKELQINLQAWVELAAVGLGL